MRYVKTSTFIYMVVASLCIMFSNLIEVKSDYSAYTYLSILLLIEIFVFVWANTKSNGTLLNFSLIFILLLALFNFGQVFLIGLFPKALIEKTVVLKYFTAQEGYSALKWMNCAFVIISCFILFNTYQNPCEYDDSDIAINQNLFIRKAFLLIGLTFPIKLFIDMNFLIRAVTIGFEYGKSWLNSFPNFIRTIGDFSVIGFAFLIVSLKNNPRRQFKWFAVIVLYFMLLMLSGRRSETVSYLCVILYLLIATRQNGKQGVSIKKVIRFLFIGIFGYLVLLFLYTVVRTRETTGVSISYVFDRMMYYNSRENIILEEIREYGQTGYTAIAVLENWLPQYGPSYGTSYILGVSAIFPNIGGLMGSLTEKSTFGLALSHTPGVLNSLYTNIGGNVLGEFFFNFGKIGGLVASAVLGIIVGKTNSKVIQNIKKLNYSVIYTIPVMFSVLYWIRDYFGDCIRDIVWGLAICWIINKVDVGIRNASKEQRY